MKDLNTFDEIARRKLAERSFAFDEADWKAVETALPGRRRLRAGWWWLAVLLLPIAPALWFLTTSSDHRPAVAEGPAIHTANSPEAQRTRGTSVVPVPQGTATPARMSGTAAPTPSGAPARPAIPAPRTDRSVRRTGSAREGTVRANADPAMTTRLRNAEASIARSDASPTRSAEPPLPVHGTTPNSAVTTVQESLSDQARPQEPLHNGASDPQMNDATPVDAVPGTEPPGASTAPVDRTEPGMPADPAIADQGQPAPPATGTNAPPVASVSEARIDSLKPGVALPPTASSGHWEVNLLAGAASTLYQYGSNDGADAGMDIERANAAVFGAELMQMGAHFGFGGGVHLSAYPERIHAAELNSTEQISYTHWFLSTIDTSIMVVLDTVLVGGEVYYVTGQLDTSFQVLGSEILTNTLTHQQREARELVNRVSYVEVPLLFDVHERLGARWNVGLRGGPTIAFLASSRGALPNSTGDGYFELQRDRLRPVVFGYAARAYVRYALNDAWAVGIEPGISGQLTSTLTDDGPDRKSRSFGACFSITYRIP